MRKQNFSIDQLIVNSINGFPFPGGIGMGRASYLVPADSATSRFKSQLVKNGVRSSEIYSALSDAYSDCTAYRNDVIFAFPGDYLATAEQDLDKDFTHIIGVDSNIEGDWTQGGVNFYTTGIAVVSTFDISAKRSTFMNFKVTNAGANAACLQGVFLSGEGAVFKNVQINGACAATQAGTALAGSLTIGRGAYFPRFEDCVIGNNTASTRTTSTNAPIQFTNSNAATESYCPDNGVFKNCKILSISIDAACSAVHCVLKSMDRIWLFDNCVFYNYYVGTNGLLNECFDDNDTYYTHQFVLKDCVNVGWHEWQDSDIGFESVVGAMPASAIGGGVSQVLTGAHA